MKEFKIAQIFNENVCLGGKANGLRFRRTLETALDHGKVKIDFEGLPLTAQAFCDEFLGPLVAKRGRMY